MPGRFLLPPLPYIVALVMLTDPSIPLAVGIFAFGLACLIIAQYHAPDQFRPLTLSRRIIQGTRARIQSHQARRRTIHSAQARALSAQLSRPCWQCHQSGSFSTIRRPKPRNGAVVAFEILVILLVITPLTCGFGLILIPLLWVGCETDSLQQCQNCGAERPH